MVHPLFAKKEGAPESLPRRLCLYRLGFYYSFFGLSSFIFKFVCPWPGYDLTKGSQTYVSGHRTPFRLIYDSFHSVFPPSISIHDSVIQVCHRQTYRLTLASGILSSHFLYSQDTVPNCHIYSSVPVSFLRLIDSVLQIVYDSTIGCLC